MSSGVVKGHDNFLPHFFVFAWRWWHFYAFGQGIQKQVMFSLARGAAAARQSCEELEELDLYRVRGIV